MKNKLLKTGETIIRVLETTAAQALIIDCIKRTMPKWVDLTLFKGYIPCTEQDLINTVNIIIPDINTLDSESSKIMHRRFTMIASVLPYIADKKQRNSIIKNVADENNINVKTVKNYLCLYLVFQNIAILAPMKIQNEKALTDDEKNMRWALNKFFYTQHKNSLNTAYNMMLKEKYCINGVLLAEYPSIHQFKYFYRKTRSMQTYFISRNGLKNYQRNNRPFLGCVQDFASFVGVGMLDYTVCDIYLINDVGKIVGRPILTVCIDAYSGLCCGYYLSWEGGVYSLTGLVINILSDKVKLFEKYGININKSQWNCSELPAVFVTDMGAEYKSETFEQIAELGVKVINLPPYRPELKGICREVF